MKTVLIAAALLGIPAAIAAYLWIRGWRSVIENERANAIVVSLADSTRTLHRDHVELYDGGDDDVA